MCAQTAPEPWYYRVYAEQTGADRGQLLDVLEMLHLEGLIQKAPGNAETGPGITLTERGRQVVEDPEAMQRLVAGEGVGTGDVGSTIRQSLRQRTRPVVTQLIVAANVAVFAVGAVMAAQTPGLLSEYLVGFMQGGHSPQWVNLMERLGILTVPDLLRGQWWRLMTAAFLHDGFLHIGMNMYALWMLGAFVEQTWGRWRFLAMYLLSAWGGSCLAISYTQALLGASGAVCGMLGVEAIWILLYGRYLPQNMARRGRSAMVTNILLIVFISLIPRVSWEGHLGGGLTGAAAALVLHFQRFGPRVLRFLGVLALPLMAWGWFAYLQHVRVEMATPKTEAGLFLRDQADSVNQAINRTLRTAQAKLNPLLNQHASRREAKKVEEAIAAMREQKEAVDAVLQRLPERPFRDEAVENARLKADEALRACLKLCDVATVYLEAGERAKHADEERLTEQFGKVDDLGNEWKTQLNKIAAEKR
jgi:membrane associated rhomboid family serine protease